MRLTFIRRWEQEHSFVEVSCIRPVCHYRRNSCENNEYTGGTNSGLPILVAVMSKA